MKQHSSGLVIGLVGSIILGFGIVAGIWLGLNSIGSLGYEPSVLRATKTGSNSAIIELSAFPDSNVCHVGAGAPQIDWVTYCPTTSLEVPPNSVITVTIKQYDSASTLINDYFRQVRGTDQMLNGKPIAMLNGKPFSEVSADASGHTFTIQSGPNSPYPIFVNVPLVGVPENAPDNEDVEGHSYPTPNIISFQFRTGPAGISYIWHCYVPCGSDRGVPYGFSGPMATTGYMSGTMTVSSY